MKYIDKIINIARSSIGSFFIFVGLLGTIGDDFTAGLFMMLAGISLLPILYKKTKLVRFKFSPIILPIIFLILMTISVPNTSTNRADAPVTIQENKKIELENLNFEESNIEMNIQDTKDITLKISPNNADIEGLECHTSNQNIADVKIIKKSEIESETKIQITAISEGNCEIFVKSPNGIESNRITIKVINKEITESKNNNEMKLESEAKIEINQQQIKNEPQQNSKIESNQTVETITEKK